LRHFEFQRARSAQEAVALLSEHPADAVPIAGGTDMLVRIKQRLAEPALLIDLSGVPELHGIELTPEGLRIGAMVTHSEIASSPIVEQYAPLIRASSISIGSLQTRNLGTIGGNVMSCVPSNDSPPALLVLDARATVLGPKGERHVRLEELFLAPRCPAVGPGEILTKILIPSEELNAAGAFMKFGRRKAMSLALVNVAACTKVDDKKNSFTTVRLGLGAVAPTPIRARKAETFLTGKPVSEDTLTEAARIAAGEAKPIDDFRSSASYRRELIEVLTRRALTEAIEKRRA
jgi:CO/xanthine dehydrogenase FAD-binding subunit